MKTASSLCVLAAAAVLSGPADALYKCESNGAVAYQDRPCVTGAETAVEMVIPTFGESPRVPVRRMRATAEAPAKDEPLVAVPVFVAVPTPKN